MGNFLTAREYIYVVDTLIDQNQNNTNENLIFDAHNAAFDATTGHFHTGNAGDGPILGAESINLAANYAWTGFHTWTQTIQMLDGASTDWYSDDATTLQASISGTNGASFFNGSMNLNAHELNGLAMAGSPAGTDAANVNWVQTNTVQSVAGGTNVNITGTGINPIVNVNSVVTSVGASSPLSSSGGTTPSISFTGILGITHGGTGTSTIAGGGYLPLGGGTMSGNINLGNNSLSNINEVFTTSMQVEESINFNDGVNNNAQSEFSIGTTGIVPTGVENLLTQTMTANSSMLIEVSWASVTIGPDRTGGSQKIIYLVYCDNSGSATVQDTIAVTPNISGSDLVISIAISGSNIVVIDVTAPNFSGNTWSCSANLKITQIY